MSLINRIEIANFLNLDNLPPSSSGWTPGHAHTLINCRGNNTAIVATNGVGKTTINMAMYAILVRDRSFTSAIKSVSAPRRCGGYTHVRIEVLFHDKPREPLLLEIGQDVPGEAFVLGLYANSDDDVNFYAYQGHLEDCPVVSRHKDVITLSSNQDFREMLKGLKDEGVLQHLPTKEEWLRFVGKHFDMSLMEQLVAYQKASGGDSSEDFFSVKRRRPDGGMDPYDAALFYAHFAPEVLAKAMRGERDDEDRFEDTILNSARPLIRAELKYEKSQIELERHQKTFAEIEKVNHNLSEWTDAKRRLDEAVGKLAGEVGFVFEITEQRPLPGIPQELHEKGERTRLVANGMIVSEGEWMIPDRLLAKIWDADARQVNEAAERTGKKGRKVRQPIEILCDSDFSARRHTGAPPNQAYALKSALRLTDSRTKFAEGWTREDVLRALRDGYAYRIQAGEANPERTKVREAREILGGIERDLEGALENHEAAGKLLEQLSGRIRSLEVDEYALLELRESGLFSSDELSEPLQTGEIVQEALKTARIAREAHERRYSELTELRAAFRRFRERWPDGEPAVVLEGLQAVADAAEEAVAVAREAHITTKAALNDAMKMRRSAEDVVEAAGRERFELEALAQQVEAYDVLYPGEDPDGLEAMVTQAYEAAGQNLRKQQDLYAASRAEAVELARGIAAIEKVKAAFFSQFGEETPQDVADVRRTRRDAATREKADVERRIYDSRRQLEDLSKASTAAGRMANEVLDAVDAVTHTEPRRLYQVVEEVLAEDGARRRLILSHFSHVLHAPVVADAQAAKVVLEALEEQGLEAPVFWEEGLVRFCSDGAIDESGDLMTGILSGCPTLQVEGIFDPHKVEERRQKLSTEIKAGGVLFGALCQELDHLEDDSASSILVRAALEATACGEVSGLSDALAEIHGETSIAIPDHAERRVGGFLEAGGSARVRSLLEEHAQIIGTIDTLSAGLPHLKERAEGITLIHAALELQDRGGRAALERLLLDMDAKVEARVLARNTETAAQNKLETQEATLREAEALSHKSAIELAECRSDLNLSLTYLEQDGEQFDATYIAQLTTLTGAEVNAVARVGRFQFEAADRALEAERRSEGAGELEAKRKHAESALYDAQDKINDLRMRETETKDRIHEAEKRMLELDHIVGEISKILAQARKAVADAALTSEQIETATKSDLVDMAYGDVEQIWVQFSDADSPFEYVTGAMDDLLDTLRKFNLLTSIPLIRQYTDQKTQTWKAYVKNLNELVCNKGVTLSETERYRLGEALEEGRVSRIDEAVRVYERHVRDSEKRVEAFQGEHENLKRQLSESLNMFTLRVEDYFRVMKSCLKPDKNDGAGFEIMASIIGREGIKATVEKVIELIRGQERAREDLASRNVVGESQREYDDRMRGEIKNMIYRSIFSGEGETEEQQRSPRIYVRHPQIGKGKRIRLDQKVSTGQSNALVLLLITKMADFTMRRDEMADLATVGRRRSKGSQSRFVMIDGLFSNLSDPSLIRSSLEAIGKMKGKFQLIGWIHNAAYENDPEIFPEHIGLRRIGNEKGFILVDSHEDQTPGTQLKDGNIGIIEMHVDPLSDQENDDE